MHVDAELSETLETIVPSVLLKLKLTVTVAGAPATQGSRTVSCTTYVPSTSATKVGVAVVAPVSVALLPGGIEVRLQAKVIGSPSGSKLWEPSRCTVVPTWMMIWLGPASAIGAELVVLTVTVLAFSCPSAEEL